MEVDDAKVFKILDLEDIEKTFSAYQRQQVLKLGLLIVSLSAARDWEQGKGQIIIKTSSTA